MAGGRAGARHCGAERGQGRRYRSDSCTSAGNCSAGGYYQGGSARLAFVAEETGGRWQVNAVSCDPAGDCSAVGIYADGQDKAQAFVISQMSGDGI